MIKDVSSHVSEAGANVRSVNSRGQSALHLAALAQSPETVEILLMKGANIFLNLQT